MIPSQISQVYASEVRKILSDYISRNADSTSATTLFNLCLQRFSHLGVTAQMVREEFKKYVTH